MDNNSFLSGLSSIGEAIGESSYGRCISLLVVGCEPAQEALAVRLGGPGCPWVTLALPMQRPVVLHRQGSVRVPRRATELAFATPDYALSPAADADGVQPSRAMVAMDVLTASGMHPAGTALSVSTTANATGDNPVLELAATGAAAVDGEGEDGPAAEAPLHVHFRWAVGEVLPGAPDHTPSPSLSEEEAEAEAASHTHEPHEQGDEDDDHHDGTDIPAAGAAEANAEADTTSGMPSPWSAPPLHRLSSDQPDGASVTMATASALGSPTHGAPSPRRTSETVVGETAASPRQLDPTNDDDGGTPAREGGGSAPPPTPPLEDDADGSEAAAPFHFLNGSRPIVPGAGSSTPPATGEGDEEEGDFADELIRPQRNPSVQSRASGTYTPSSRSNTPRRQRPSNYRRSTIHMEIAPAVVAPSKAAASNADEEEPTDDTVHISDDDDDDTGALMTHHPPPPPPPPPANPAPPQAAATASLETPRTPSRPLPSLEPELVEPAPAAANVATSGTTVNQHRTSRRGSAHQTASPASATAVPTHTPQPPASMHRDHHVEMAEAKPAPARTRPTVDNLFEGADDAALIVTVGVVAVYNAKGAADPHRVVAVALEAASSATTLAFRTTPALRGLATAVPQLSAPVLLLSGAAAKDHDDNDGSALPVLQATCVVTEQVGGGSANRDSDGADSGAASTASTTLWSSTADVAPSCAPSPSSAAQINHEVRFTGANGDVVLTLWTYMTVSAYRDAVLNLRSRVAQREAPQQQQQPVLQMLLVDESARAQRQGTTSRRHTPTASVWVSSPCTSEASRADAVTHRVVAVAAPTGIVHQPVSVPLRNPFVFVAVQPANAPAYVQPIFTRMFSQAWTRSTAAAHKGSSKSARVVLYYRIVGSATAAAAAAADPSSMPPPLRDTSSSSSPHRASESPELRELTISIEPPAYPLHALPSDKLHHDADAGAAPFGGWSLVLRHAVTHTILAHSASAASGLTYRGFLPLASDAHSASCKRVTATAAAPEANSGAGEEMARLPWEVLLVSEEAGRGASTSARPRTGAMRAITRGPAAGKAGAAAWSGSLWVSCAALYSAPSSGAHWAMSVCVSSASVTASTSALRTPSVALGAALRVRCAVRAHALGADSAVFCLRSLHLVASPVAGAAPPQSSSPAQSTPSLPPSRVQLWFTTGGSTPDEVRAAWAAEADAEVPSVKQLQRAWAPAVAAAHCSATPPLAVNAEGRLQPAGAPVLLSTCNTRARLCIALTSTAEAASGTTDGLPDARALQRGVTAVRESAVRRYRRGQVTEDSHSSDESSDDRRGERAPLTEAQMGDVFVECVTAVAMRVDNYAEVDLSPSLVAASERPGQTRHRLLLSSVSGTVRMSRHILLELQGQWIKMPRRVAVVSDEYTPSPRLWGLRCSCVVRRPDSSPRVPYSAAAADAADGADLAQEVLEAHLGYDIVVQSVPLDYGDPSEHTVQTLLPGLSYDKLVVQMKARDARLRPYRESIRSAPSGPPNPSLRRGGRSTMDDDGATAFEDTAELLEHVFGPTGLAHATYMSESSHKVAVAHFVFGDAYTTRTILSVACAPSAAAAAVNAMTSTPSKPYSNGHSPVPRPPSSPLPLSASVSGAAGVAGCAVQVSCDSLTRTATVYSFLSESAVMREFPGVSHRRYAPELTWYHGGLSIAPSEELRRREAGEAAWRCGLTEQRLGPHQAPGPLVVSAVTHHPFDCLPLVVEPSLTRCGEGRYCVAFGGLSTVTGTPSASVYVFDAVAQMWRSLRSRRSLRGTLSASVPAGLPPARYGHTAVFRPANGAVYIFGGRGVRDGAMSDAYSAATPATVFADVWSLACDAAAGCVTATELRCAWAESSAAAPGSGSESRMSSLVLAGDFEAALARWRHAAVLHDDYLVVLGGQSSSGACCSCAELLYLDIKTQEWAPRRSFGVEVPCPRYGLAAATLSGSAAVYVFGGWGAEQDAAAAAATDKAPQNGSGANGKAAGKDGVVALSDFFKMDLITRMWSRVEANGAVRPPALDLPDMTSSLIDGCPVLLLVGGRVAGPVTAASEPPSTADLDIFLFSTATLFWRRVAMDCMPVPTRFGLRAVASAATGTARPMAAGPTRGPVRPDTSRLRRTLPSRGQRIGDVLVVGGLPLNEADVANTAPAISLLLAAGDGSITGAGRRVASASPAAGESQPEMLTPRPPAASRSPRARRPVSGPARVSARKPATPLRSPRQPAVVATSGWLHSIQQPRSTDGWADADVVGRQPAPPTASAVAIRKAVDRLHATAPTPPPRLPQHHTSCYSTLTRAEQRRLVHRLYTQDLEVRAARRQQLEAEMYDQQHKPLAHHINKSRSRSPGGRQPRLASAPVHRPHYDAASLTSPSAPRDAADGAAAAGFFPGSTAADAPVAHRDLQGAFLGRGSSTSPTTSSSRLSSESPSADEESDEEVEASTSASTVKSEVDAVAEPLVPGVEEAADRSAASVSDSPDDTDDASSTAKASAASAPEREAAAPPPISSADSFEKESEDSDKDGASDAAPPPPPAAPVAAPATVSDKGASETDDDDFESDSSADSYVVARPEQQERSASSVAAPAPEPAPVPVPASEQTTTTSRSASAAEALPASAAASSSSSRPATPPTPEQEEVHDAAATAPSTPPEMAISPTSSSVHSAAAAVPLPSSPPRGSDAEQEDEEHEEEPATDKPVPASVADEPAHEEEEQQQPSPAAAAAEDASGAPPDSYDGMDDDWEAESEPEEENEDAVAAEVRDASVAEIPSETEEEDDAIHEVAEEAAKSASSVPSSQSSAAPVPEDEDEDDDDWEAESSEATKSDAAALAADEVPPSRPSSPMSSEPASEVAAEEAEPPHEQQPPSSAPTSSAASRSSSAHEHEEEAPRAATPAVSNGEVSEVSAAPSTPPVEESHGDHDDGWEAVSDEAGAKSSSNVDAAVLPPALDDDADTGAEESSIGSAVAPSEDDGLAAVPPPAPREHPTPPSSPSSSSAAVPTPPADTDQDEASSEPSHVDEDVEQPFAEEREAPFSAAVVEARAASGSSASSAEMSAQPSIPLTLQSSDAAHRQSLAVTPLEVLCEDEEWNGDEDQKFVLPPSVKSEIGEETPADNGAAAEVPPAEAPEVEEATAAHASEEGEATAESSAATDGAGAVPAAPEAEEIGGDDSDAASVATSAPARPASPPDESVEADEERPDVPEEEAEEVDASHEQAATPPHDEAEEVNTDEDSLSSPASSLDESAVVMVHDAANTSAPEPPEELEGDAAAGEEAEAEAAAEAAAREHHLSTPSTPSESDLGDDAPAQPQPDDAPVDDEESADAQAFEEPEASPPSHISEAGDEADVVASEPELPDHKDDEADDAVSEPELPDHNDDEADDAVSEPELPDHNDDEADDAVSEPELPDHKDDEADNAVSEPELPDHNDGDDDEAAPATPPSVPSSASAPVPPQPEEEAVDEEGDVESGNEGLEEAASAPADESHEASTEHPMAAHNEEGEPAEEADDVAPSDLPPPRMPAPRRSAQSSHVSSVGDDGEEEDAAGEAPASVLDTDSDAAPAAEAAVDDAHGAQSSSADEVSAAGSRPADEEEEEAPRTPEPAEGEEAAASEASALSSPDPAVQPSTLTGYAEEAEVPPPPPALAAAAEESPYEEAGDHGEAAEAQAQASAEDAAASSHSSLLSSISAADDLEPTEESAAAAAPANDGSDDADEEGAEAAAEAPAEVAEATPDPTDGESEAAAAEEERSTGEAVAGAAVEGESVHGGAVEEVPEAPVVDDAGSSEEPATDADAPQSATDRSGAVEEGEEEWQSVEPPAAPAADTTAVISAVENADDAADAAALPEHPSRAEEEVGDEEVGHADDFDSPHEGSGTDEADASEEEAAAPASVKEDVPSGAATEKEATEADAPLDNADASEASELSEAAPAEETPEAAADPGEEAEAADVNEEQPASPWEEQLIEASAEKPLVLTASAQGAAAAAPENWSELSASEHNGSGSGAPADPFAPALTAESSFPVPAPVAGQEAKGGEETESAEELSADAAPAPAAPATPPSVGSDGEASQHGEVAQEQEQEQGLEVAEEPADATELDDGRDLLDRHRGVEEEVQDDDFDF